jgi:hypothetical protein
MNNQINDKTSIIKKDWGIIINQEDIMEDGKFTSICLTKDDLKNLKKHI